MTIEKGIQSLRRFDIGREILKWIAIGTMTIDHIGAIIYPDLIILRIIGRIAFPIFCYLLVLGMESTRNKKNYFTRLLVFALISQVPFYLALGYQPFEMLNIFFTLSFGALLIMNPIMIIIPIVVSLFANFDYGLYGIILIAGTRFLKTNMKYGIVLLILVSALPLMELSIQAFSLLALPIIFLHNIGYIKKEREISENAIYPKWTKYLYYIYYPLHLSLLYFFKLYFT